MNTLNIIKEGNKLRIEFDDITIKNIPGEFISDIVFEYDYHSISIESSYPCSQNVVIQINEDDYKVFKESVIEKFVE